jgi:hypothetical protein
LRCAVLADVHANLEALSAVLDAASAADAARGILLVRGSVHPAPDADLRLSSDARVARSIQALQDRPWG